MLSICPYQFICNFLCPSLTVIWAGGNEERGDKNTILYAVNLTHIFNNFYIHQCNFCDKMRVREREIERRKEMVRRMYNFFMCVCLQNQFCDRDYSDGGVRVLRLAVM